jgi:hypothetical protein
MVRPGHMGDKTYLVPIQKFLPGFCMNLKGTAAEPFN